MFLGLMNRFIVQHEPWKTARDRFNQLLGTRLQATFMASTWIGGSYINNDFKGDPGGRSPIGQLHVKGSPSRRGHGRHRVDAPVPIQSLFADGVKKAKNR